MHPKRQLIVCEQPKSPIAETLRTLRINMQFANVDGDLQCILFTSAGPQEGKSTVAANTAVALAQSGKDVILMDCDLRKPIQHKIFCKKNEGVTNFLMEENASSALIQKTNIDNLRLVLSGPIPPNPSELLGSARMKNLITVLKEQCDTLLIDTSPVIAVTDALVLASHVNGIILVIAVGKTRPDMAQKAKELLLRAKGYILGVVLNRVEIEEEHSCYFYGEKKEK